MEARCSDAVECDRMRSPARSRSVFIGELRRSPRAPQGRPTNPGDRVRFQSRAVKIQPQRSRREPRPHALGFLSAPAQRDPPDRELPDREPLEIEKLEIEPPDLKRRILKRQIKLHCEV